MKTAKNTVKTAPAAAIDLSIGFKAQKSTKKTAAETFAADAAVKPTEKTAKPEKGKWDSGLSKVECLTESIEAVCDAIDGVEKSTKVAARALHTLKSQGFHTVAGWTNFAEWFLTASVDLGRAMSKPTVYRLVAAGAALAEMGEAEAAVCEVPMSDLAAYFGAVSKSVKTAEGRGAALRTASKKFSAARAGGKKTPDALIESGMAKPKTADTGSGLDQEGKAQRLAGSAMTLADKSYAEAISLLHSAIDRLKREQAAAVSAARGK